MTYPHLQNAPEDHLSPEFIDYLREHNVVVYETHYWLVIENCKYHKENSAWYTAFYKLFPIKTVREVPVDAFRELFAYVNLDWQILIKRQKDRTVDRFHVHIIE